MSKDYDLFGFFFVYPLRQCVVIFRLLLLAAVNAGVASTPILLRVWLCLQRAALAHCDGCFLYTYMSFLVCIYVELLQSFNLFCFQLLFYNVRRKSSTELGNPHTIQFNSNIVFFCVIFDGMHVFISFFIVCVNIQTKTKKKSQELESLFVPLIFRPDQFRLFSSAFFRLGIFATFGSMSLFCCFAVFGEREKK